MLSTRNEAVLDPLVLMNSSDFYLKYNSKGLAESHGHNGVFKHDENKQAY